MKKRVTSCLLSVSMMAGLLSGVGSINNVAFAASPEGEIEIFTRFADGASAQFFQDAADAYMASHEGAKITVSAADNEDYKQQINVRLASNDAPDIYFAWSGTYAGNFANSGRALDLTDYVNDDTEWSDTIIRNQWGPFTFNDKIYGVPIIMDGKAFYYNQDIFEEQGLKVPETWDEFKDVLDKLSKTDYIPISLGNVDDWATGHYMTTLNQRMVDPDTLSKDYALEGDEDNFTDPQYVAALDKLLELVPYFTPDCNATSYDTGINDFITGKAAIYYEQFNQVQYIMPAEFNWSWFDFPDIADGKGDQNALTGAPQGLMVSATTEYPDLCVDFLKFLTSSENAQKMVKDCSMISCVDGAINSDTADEKVVEIADTIKQASSITLWLDNAMASSELEATYLADIQSMVGGNMTSSEVMEDVQNAVAEAKADE